MRVTPRVEARLLLSSRKAGMRTLEERSLTARKTETNLTAIDFEMQTRLVKNPRFELAQKIGE